MKSLAFIVAKIAGGQIPTRACAIAILGAFLSLLFERFASSQEPDSNSWMRPIQTAVDSQNFDLAEKLASVAVSTWPNHWRVYLTRGEAYFRAGKIAESLADFDECLKLNPRMAPSFWQRGLTLYYAGKFQQGREQFEIHRTVNPNDVENPFWHFLCVAKLEGVEIAQENILPCGLDARPPLMDILDLIHGKKSFDEVSAAIAAMEKLPNRDPSALFYGNYYLGLYLDALGQIDKAEEFLAKSVAEKLPGYMPDAARVHLELLRAGKLPGNVPAKK